MSLEHEIVSEIKIISGHAIFNENAVVMSKKFGWALEKEFNPKPKDLYIVFGGHEMAHHLLEIQYRLNNTFGFVVMNSEQPDSQFMKNKYYISLMKRNVVMDYNTLSANYLKETYDIKVLSYYYFEFLQFNLETKERPYDVCFIGSKNERREKIIQGLQEQYPDLKFYVDYEWSHKNSDSLTKILHECKLVLNIPYYEENALETHRIHKALACNCKVISMPSADEDTNEFYKKYITITDNIDLSMDDLVEPDYENLISNLSKRFNPHLLFVINEIHKKLNTV